ncbi:MAG: bifunctional diguanylate cyclase/phosphodiesterase, partial [Lachnospiraceae bacterium]|nr:bifunctional diguanylate cyclase/phosphodiesterase [Lachnospiraceae bacterium]
KNVNDTLGHDYGDELLIQVAEKLADSISNGDILARTGGDEFLIFKNYISSYEDAEETAKSLVDITKHPFLVKDETVHVSISVGISHFPEHGLSLTELIKNADIAMYSAKAGGKNNYQIFNSTMADGVNHKNEIIAILQEALANGEIYMVYQPQADVVSGKIIGFEALMRLNSSIAGFIPPSEFIPVAEECGIIEELGDWALFEACSFNQRLINEGFKPIIVSVNVSTTQLKGDHLISTLERVEEETGMSLKYLELEITESILMNDLDHNLDLINRIKAMGAMISLDDFGTGYSSFNYLTQIPINTLKIDKAFIDNIYHNEKDRYIADTIISLAHKMDIRVIAEGVEDINQLQILQSQMCDIIQGYYFSRPIEEDSFIELLQKN